MTEDCCYYYVLQFKNQANIWLDTSLNSKILSEVTQFEVEYKSNHIGAQTRIQQRNIKDDRNLGRKVPRCC